jgi:hypothetical protein
MRWLRRLTRSEIASRLARIESKIDDLTRAQQRGFQMAQADINNLSEKVERMRTVAESSKTLIQGLAQQIRDAADDPAELKALADQLDASATSLAEAVAANTPTP